MLFTMLMDSRKNIHIVNKQKSSPEYCVKLQSSSKVCHVAKLPNWISNLPIFPVDKWLFCRKFSQEWISRLSYETAWHMCSSPGKISRFGITRNIHQQNLERSFLQQNNCFKQTRKEKLKICILIDTVDIWNKKNTDNFNNWRAGSDTPT